MAPEEDYADALRDIQAMAPDALRRLARSVTSAIRGQPVSASAERRTPEDDRALMGDLLLLGALREVLGRSVLRDAGVARLAVLSLESTGDGTWPWPMWIALAH